MVSVQLVERCPSVEEYCRLILAVGWKSREREAIARALAHSLFAVCAESDGEAIGMGRVIGDGGLHYYLTDVVVVPARQRCGAGAAPRERLALMGLGQPHVAGDAFRDHFCSNQPRPEEHVKAQPACHCFNAGYP